MILQIDKRITPMGCHKVTPPRRVSGGIRIAVWPYLPRKVNLVIGTVVLSL